MDLMRPGRGSRIARPTERGGGADGIFDGRTIPLQLRGITAFRPRASRQQDRKRRTQEQEPMARSDRPNGGGVEYCPLSVRRRNGPSATGLSGLAELALGAITDEPGDVGQIVGVGTATEHDFDDGGVPDALGLFAAPAVSGLGE